MIILLKIKPLQMRFRLYFSSKVFFLLLIYSLFFTSCASLKIVERSAKEKPIWINGLEQNFLTGVGVGNNYDEAKMIALQMVKEKIVSAVAQSISFEQNIQVNESRYRNAYKFLEEYTSKSTSKSGNISYLQGVSLSKASDYYYEKHRENKIEKFFYYIKYPFSQEDIEKLIVEWKKQEDLLSQRLDSLKFNEKNYSSVESIIEEIEELQYLSDFFVDQRKAVSDISIKSLQNKLNSILVVPFIDTAGIYSYQLMLGENEISTNQIPVIKSNCAKILKVDARKSSGNIFYEFDNCNIEDQNYIEIDYNFEEWKLSHKVPFDVSSKKISIEQINNISFISVKKGWFSSKHLIKCYFTVYSKSPVPFKINRIELTPMLCKMDCPEVGDYKRYPGIIFENVNQKFDGKGPHSFEVYVEVPKKLTKKWASRNGLSSIASGKIHYSSDLTKESKVCEINNVNYTTNW